MEKPFQAKLKKPPFTLVDNSVLDDPEISLKAKGLLAVLIMHGNDKNLTLAKITKMSKDERTSTASALNELLEKHVL